MAEPSRRASRLLIAGAMLAVFAIGGGGFVLGRSTGQSPPTPPPPAAPSPSLSATPPTLPAVQPPLGRGELIAAAAGAADAIGAGRPLPENVTQLAGRDFELRLPFGCPGLLQAHAGSLSVEYDEAAEALRARVEPVRWAPEEWLPNPENMPEAEPRAESIEGFWVARPWTSSEDCPPAGAAPASGQLPAASADQTLGIGQFFMPEDSRVGRRDGRAYEAVQSVAREALELKRGLHLRLRGKLTRAPGAGPVLCRALSHTRPVCLVAVTLDEVAVLNPATGAALATWDVSSQNQERAQP